MSDKSEAQKKREFQAQQACTPVAKPTQADIDKANGRFGPTVPDAPPEVIFTELGWAVCRDGFIVRLFDGPAEARGWLKQPVMVAA